MEVFFFFKVHKQGLDDRNEFKFGTMKQQKLNVICPNELEDNSLTTVIWWSDNFAAFSLFSLSMYNNTRCLCLTRFKRQGNTLSTRSGVCSDRTVNQYLQHTAWIKLIRQSYEGATKQKVQYKIGSQLTYSSSVRSDRSIVFGSYLQWNESFTYYQLLKEKSELTKSTYIVFLEYAIIASFLQLQVYWWHDQNKETREKGHVRLRIRQQRENLQWRYKMKNTNS